MGDRTTLVEKLLDGYRSKAHELLMDYLRNEKIRTETEQYIGQNEPSSKRVEEAFEQQHKPSRNLPRRSDLSLQQGRIRKDIPDARNGLYTPSNSAGSVKSEASSLASAGLERIYLISCDEIEDQPVTSRSEPVKHCLIGDRVVNNRSLAANKIIVDERVNVPLRSGGQKSEKATTAVSLTWRRRKEFTTNVDTFYIVSALLLGCDVILSSDPTLNRRFPSEVEEVQSPQERYDRRGFVDIEEVDPASSQYPPAVPLHSYPQNSLPPNMQRTYDITQAFRSSQRMRSGEPSAPVLHPTRIEHGLSNHAPTPYAAQEPSSGLLHLAGLWDKTPIKISFDPEALGETFFQAFSQWAVKRKRDGDLDRQRMTLWLKASKNMPDDEAYELSLKEGELEDLWEDAVKWIQENRGPKAPHLYAIVELEAG
ncbi:uncharacterized protein EKO05_0006845 [Ascochyta rabiei]|uniref:Uncharacterized protein n=1 Tax=Didymella rabiei TaxID=5454 RepID=A0A163JA25_DIDRA|nr:uncharacterized protein EKO05_0006845 [Ascochyta rabiei]KZM26237.1 hypothetical protein ST47_g2629 [Ascochyta rabiei]UPX16446.1 hypothetical protein EKO05_0006845 [Ascochyta rabiei]